VLLSPVILLALGLAGILACAFLAGLAIALPFWLVAKSFGFAGLAVRAFTAPFRWLFGWGKSSSRKPTESTAATKMSQMSREDREIVQDLASAHGGAYHAVKDGEAPTFFSFNILELMIAMSVIGVIATGMVVLYSNHYDTLAARQVRADLTAIHAAVNQYLLREAAVEYPRDLRALEDSGYVRPGTSEVYELRRFAYGSGFAVSCDMRSRSAAEQAREQTKGTAHLVTVSENADRNGRYRCEFVLEGNPDKFVSASSGALVASSDTVVGMPTVRNCVFVTARGGSEGAR
jgi:type II secretory pathway pseudopilin PulG